MKKTIVLLICLFLSFGVKAQNIIGAWETFSTANEDKHRSVIIFAEGYQVFTTYNITTGEFINSYGGSWRLKGDVGNI